MKFSVCGGEAMKFSITLDFDKVISKLRCLIGIHEWAYNGGEWHRVRRVDWKKYKIVEDYSTTPLIAFKLCNNCGTVRAQLRGTTNVAEIRGDISFSEEVGGLRE